jgi:CRP-like cAMP-binding protein
LPHTTDLPISNLFLSSLPAQDYEALRPHLEPVTLPSRRILHHMHAPIDHCYFADDGMISLMIQHEDGVNVEAGVVGREGFSGASAMMGFERMAPHTNMVQLPGSGVRIAVDVLHREMLIHPALLQKVMRFVQVLNVQISHTAACNARHTLQERLARWLLLAHDRSLSGELPLTQEFVSIMLGVRRAGVNAAARSLQKTGAIDYERARVVVLDRARLEEMSCECYNVVRRVYNTILGWPDPAA